MTRTKNAWLALIAIFMTPMAANAVPISTSAGDFEVTTVEGTFEGLSALLMAQVWWGDLDLALEFAGQNLLGLPIGGALGPLFATSFDGDLVRGGVWVDAQNRATGFSTAPDNPSTYAIAERITVPEPTTLSLLVAGLVGFGLMRRRRHAA